MTTTYKPNYIKKVEDLTTEEYNMWRVACNQSKEEFATVRVHYKKDGTLIRVDSAERTPEAQAALDKRLENCGDYMKFLKLVGTKGRVKNFKGVSARQAREAFWKPIDEE